jgi:hypothetical protein
MNDAEHNMPTITDTTVRKVADSRYFFSGTVKEISDTFDLPPDRLERMRIVRDNLVNLLFELNTMNNHSCHSVYDETTSGVVDRSLGESL